ncbi:MAG: hypothetical protein IJ368_00375 [Oscillospiraceae bacterium]|nr:hypothetical protein [Oscillospiraceae bacterium]
MQKIIGDGQRASGRFALDGTECEVIFSSPFRCFEVKNEGMGDIVISAESGKTASDSGVMVVAAQTSATYAHMRSGVDRIYITGSGNVQVVAKNEVNELFGGGAVMGGGDMYADLYRWAAGQLPTIDTGITDSEGNAYMLENAVEVGGHDELLALFPKLGVVPELPTTDAVLRITDTVSGISVNIYNDVSEPWGSGMGYSTKIKAVISDLRAGSENTVTQYNSYNGGDPENFVGLEITGLTITASGDQTIVRVDLKRVLKTETQVTYVEGALDGTVYDSSNCHWILS